jgi:hypothetical protein
MVTASPLFNNLRHSYFWILDGEYEVEKKVHHECQCRNRLNIAHRLKLARELLEGMIEEEAKRLRGCINPPYVRVGTLKEVIDIVQDVRHILDHILTECPHVQKGLDPLKKAEELMRKELIEEVKKIKDNWSKERKDNENQKKKKEFEKLNNNWIKVQEKFRAMGHPDWIPEDEKKTKTGILSKIKRWWNKGRK